MTKQQTTNIPTDTNTHTQTLAKIRKTNLFRRTTSERKQMLRLTNDNYYDIITIITTALLYTYIFTL